MMIYLKLANVEWLICIKQIKNDMRYWSVNLKDKKTDFKIN
jgi:hypothetical protein